MSVSHRNFFTVGYLVIGSMLFGHLTARSQVITFGPMVHFNFSNQGYHYSFGLEGAIWLTRGGIDFGVEWEHKAGKITATRLYSELEFLQYAGMPNKDGGLGYVGCSLGPVWEKREGEDTQFGLQFSQWAAHFGGADLRVRFVGKRWDIAPGAFVKVGLPFIGIGHM